MLINGLNCPENLYRDIKDDKVVVFVGAGASMEKPTSLPGFVELASETARNLGKTYDKERMNPDAFLGELEHSNINVKNAVSSILKKNNPKHNGLHDSILNLFKNIESIKIVTTNYDKMLENAFSKKYGQSFIEVFSSPALPFGNDFSGIVHLHGNVDNPKGMIVTDSDFGFSYILDGYTTRFLSKLFNTYTVLFIGYSYDDVVMKYLTRSLPDLQEGNRYIITDKNEKNWSLFGITPILYKKDQHSQIQFFLNGLSSRVNRKMVGWKTRCIEISTYDPPIDPEANDELTVIFNDQSLTKIFLECLSHINFPKWLSWLDNNGFLSFIESEPKTNNSNTNDVSKHLVNWIFNNSATSNFAEVLMLINKHNNTCSEFIIKSLYIYVCEYNKKLTDTAYVRALVIIIEHMKDYKLITNHRLIEECIKRELFELGWQMYSNLLLPRFEIHDKFAYFENYTSFEGKYTYKQQPYLLQILWNESVKKGISSLSHKIVYQLVWMFEQKRKNEELFNESDEKFDYSYLFVDLEKEIDEEYIDDTKYFALLIISECLEEIYNDNKLEYFYLISRLVKSKSVSVQKIALISLMKNKSATANKKVGIVLEKLNLFDKNLHTEIFRIIGINFNEISAAYQDKILEEITYKIDFGESAEDKKILNYEVYNWLIWLSKSTQNNEKVQITLGKYATYFAGFEPREQPEMSAFTLSQSSLDDVSPLSKDSVDRMSIAELIAFFESFEETKRVSIPFFSKRALIDEITDYVSSKPQSIFEILDELIHQSNYTSDLWEVLFHSASKVELSHESLVRLLNSINTESIVEHNSIYISNYLTIFSKNKKYESILIESKNLILEILDKISNHHVLNVSLESSYSLVALNSTIHGVVITILSMIKCDNQDNGIDEVYKDQVLKYINEENSYSVYFICLFIGNYRLLYYYDEAWTRDNILILLNSLDDDIFKSSWEGLLTYSANIYTDIAPYLHEYYYKAINRQDLLSNNLSKRFTESLAVMITYTVDEPNKNFIPEFFRKSTDATRLSFLYKIKRLLKSMNDDERENTWNRWLLEFFVNISKNLPSVFPDVEIEVVISFIEFSNSNILDSIIESLLKFKPIKLREHFEFDSLLDDQFYGSSRISDMQKAKLLEYILKCDLSQINDNSGIHSLFHSISNVDQSIIEELINLGLLKQIDFTQI